MKVVDIGISEAGRKEISAGLAVMLADTYTLYLKTQNFHWNVTGPNFQQLHLLFETHYEQLAAANDTIAERIRTLGYAAPGTFAEFSRLRTLSEPEGTPKAHDMVKHLLIDHESVARTARVLAEKAHEARDEVTAELMTSRVAEHEKNAWMLRAHLEG